MSKYRDFCGPYFSIFSRIFPDICTDSTSLHNEIEFSKSVWKRNCFPFLFIDNCIKHFLDKLFITSNIFGTESEKKDAFICLEFLDKISLQSKKQLTRIFRVCQKNLK